MTIIHRQFVQLAGAAIITLGASLSSWGAEPNVVGTWKVVSYFNEEVTTGKQTALLGEHPTGYIIYTPEGRMMALIVHEKRNAPKVDEDRINLHKYMFGYSGRYTIEGEKVVHHVDVSWNESWTGTDQVRFFRLEDDRLTIKGAPAKSTFTGIESFGVIVFERER